MSEFWWTASTFLEVYGRSVTRFKIFSWQHLLWLALSAVLIGGSLAVFRRLGEKGRRRMLIAVTVLLLCDELLKYSFTALTSQFEVQFLPFHLCSVNIFTALANTLSPTRIAKNILYALCLPGALIALTVPSWTALPQWNMMFLHSESVHMLLVLYPCMLLASGFRPDYRTLPWVALFLAGVSVPAVLLNAIYDTNFLFLNGTIGNPVLELCRAVFGDVYQIGLVILLMLVWLVLYAPWSLKALRGKKGMA